LEILSKLWSIIKPELIVIHYTGSNNLQLALSRLCATGSQISAHLVIAKTGQIWQLVPFNRWAWRVGKSEYNGRPDINGFSIGIENVGIGDKWPDEQIQANIDEINALCDVYDIINIVGHDEICIPPRPEIRPRTKLSLETCWRRYRISMGGNVKRY
jgi:N-acetylmuramoyl-L-alanine amidase